MQTTKLETQPWLRLDSPAFQWGTLSLLIVLSLMVKSIHLAAPFLGHFGGYQSSMAMMAENMRAEHFRQLLYPKVFWISGGGPALEMIYYPWAALAAALGQAVFSGSMEFWGRFQAIFFSSASAIPLFLIAKRLGEKTEVAFASVLLFLFSPMMLVYGRTFINEAFSLFFLLASAAALMSGAQSWRRILFSAGLYAIALVGRFHLIVFLPLFLGMITLQIGLVRSWTRCIFFAAVALSLTVLWLFHCYGVSQISPRVHSNVFVQMATGKGFPNPLLLSPDFYLKIFDVIVNRALTPLGFILLLPGLFAFWKKGDWILLGWTGLTLSLILLLPQKVYDHGFYLLPLVPAGALLAAKALMGLASIMNQSGNIRFPKMLALVLILVWAGMVMRFYVPAAFFIPQNARNVPQVGEWVQQHTQPGDKVIAAFGSSPALLYYCRRNGWEFFMKEENREVNPYLKLKIYPQTTDDEIEKRVEDYSSPVSWLERLRGEGAQYFVASDKNEFLSNPRFADYMKRNYPLLSDSNESFVCFDLQRKGLIAGESG